MKSPALVALVLLAGALFAAGQKSTIKTDVLGAHINYGRGCPACHSAHSGPIGNGLDQIATLDDHNTLLWGQNTASLYGKTITFDSGKYAEVLPTSMSSKTPDVNGMLTCLSCHDGNYATGAMMHNKVYETLPATYGTSASIPTLLGGNGTTAGSYISDHPTGLNATISCGGPSGWDCTVSDTGVVLMTGNHSRKFVSNYGFFVTPGAYANTPVVVCTTCHNPHSMNVTTISTNSQSGMPHGNYATMFFLRAPYNPGDAGSQSNQTSQFCRQCHADKSNEMNGSSAGTIF